MKVRAKFYVSEKTERVNNQVDVKLVAVTSGSEENKQFWQYTPAGCVTMSVMNKAAADQFQIGQEYYVDFIPVSAG